MIGLRAALFLLLGWAATTVVADQSNDLELGKSVFTKCASCHQIGAGAQDRVGAAPNGIFGRRAGANDDFSYSQSMKRVGSDGLVWTFETLDAYIENPKALVSGTRMSFRGVKEASDRAALLDYLRRFSDDPSNIPEAERTATRTGHDVDAAILAKQDDPEYGEYLSGECITCHQTSGSDEGIPSITQWPEEDFIVALHAYKRKLCPHLVMQLIAGRLSDEEIAALAAYFGGLE